MKDEYTYTQLAPPPPPKGEGKSTKFKNIYDKSSFPSYHNIPYQQGLQWFELNIQSMMYQKLICLYVPLGGITS